MSSYYELLGVPRYASREEIQSAYRRIAKQVHPDISGANDANMARLNQAFEVLSDPHRRQKYDLAYTALVNEQRGWVPMSREAVDRRWVKSALWWVAAAVALWLCHSPVDLPMAMLKALR